MNLAERLHDLLPNTPPPPKPVLRRTLWTLLVPSTKDGRDETCERLSVCVRGFLRTHAHDRHHNSHARCPAECAGRAPRG